MATQLLRSSNTATRSVRDGPSGRRVWLPSTVWISLTGIVVLSAIVRMTLGRQVVAPWIMVDELIYSELAKSFATNGSFLVRDLPGHGYGFVYPVVIAPAWRLFGPVPAAYAAAKDINAVAMSLAALPAYGLARRLLPVRLALVAAAMAVIVPSMLYTGELMTESVFYPVFLTAVLVQVIALERAGARWQVALLLLCVVAYATRAQALVLFPAAAIAPVMYGWAEGDVRRTLRRFVPLYGILATAIGGAVLATAARGRSPLTFLGAYRAAADAHYSVESILRYLLWHVSELDLYVGVIPFAALLALWLGLRELGPAARAFAAATLPICVLLLVEVAAFASSQSQRIAERNTFYLAPLSFIALLGLSTDGVTPRGRRVTIAAGAIAAALLVVLPFGRFINSSAVPDTFALLPWWWLHDQGVPFRAERWVAASVGVTLSLALIIVPRRWTLVFPVLVSIYLCTTTAIVLYGRHGIHQTSVDVLRAGIKTAHPDWVDRAVGRDADVTFLWAPQIEVHPVYENEFFNRSVGEIVTTGADPWMGGLPETSAHVRARDGVVVDDRGRRLPAVRFALAGTDIAGSRVARDQQNGLSLYRVDGHLVVLTRITGVYDDSWGQRVVRYRRLQCRGGTLTVRLASDAQLFMTSQTIQIRENGRLLKRVELPPSAAPSRPRIVELPLQAQAGVCAATFSAETTRRPVAVQPGSTDRRALSAHYLSFEFSPSR